MGASLATLTALAGSAHPLPLVGAGTAAVVGLPSLVRLHEADTPDLKGSELPHSALLGVRWRTTEDPIVVVVFLLQEPERRDRPRIRDGHAILTAPRVAERGLGGRRRKHGRHQGLIQGVAIRLEPKAHVNNRLLLGSMKWFSQVSHCPAPDAGDSAEKIRRDNRHKGSLEGHTMCAAEKLTSMAAAAAEVQRAHAPTRAR
mmetsp:Transcript_69397/g.199022  ORF Transcript_69397/g.199022 Transcript_69397/m.199022 type:complete len:201 (-) Transcript_69397:26-628(-)